MDNIRDYIKWIGRFDFSDMPFNEVDNLVLCQTAYLRLPTDCIGKTLSECVRALSGNEEDTAAFSRKTDFYDVLADSRRFGNLIVDDYEEVLDEGETAQFAAYAVRLYEGQRFVAYRGTDSTLIGWKEDFMISYTRTSAQDYAVRFLERNVVSSDSVTVGGHSKGGNLALYAACHVSDEKLAHIKHLYVNDGPGLCPEVCDPALIVRVKDRTTVILPEYSVFGKLFEPDMPDKRIIKSSNVGIMQHSLLSWGVDYGSLMTTDRHSPSSMWVNSVLDRWIESANPTDRKKFADELFDGMAADGNITIDDFADSGPAGFEKLLIRLINADKDTLKTILKLPESAVTDTVPGEGRVRRFINTMRDRPWLQGVLMVAGGILLLLVPEGALELVVAIILFAIVAYEIFITIRQLYRNKWDLRAESTRVYLCIVLVTVYSMIIVKEQALFLIASAFAGSSFLALSYHSGMHAREWVGSKGLRVKYIIETVLFFILGCFVLVAPQNTIKWYAISTGIILIIDGLVNLIFKN